MQIIKAGYEIMDPLNRENILKKVERVARVCYKSEDKIGEGTAERMVKALIKRNHTAMLEHVSLVVSLSDETYRNMESVVSLLQKKYGYNSFLRFTSIAGYIVSGNIRAWREFVLLARDIGYTFPNGLVGIFRSDKYNVLFEDIGMLAYHELFPAVEVDPNALGVKEKQIHLDLTVKFIVDRGVSHEIVRHRVASFAQESTRYCNYGNNGGEITVIEPCYLGSGAYLIDNWYRKYTAWERACKAAEESYLLMLEAGATPQEARAVLPTSLKTEVVMTANLEEWRHFFSLRACGSTGKPHPQMLEVAVPLLKEIKGIIPTVFNDLEPVEI